MLIIKDWDNTFETAETRKRKRLGWVMVPTDFNSAGYVELMSLGSRGVTAFGVFIAICQWSAGTSGRSAGTSGERGRLSRSDGRPISLSTLAKTMRIDEAIVVDAVDVLTSESVGWICEETPGNNGFASKSATICRSTGKVRQIIPAKKEKEKEKEKDKEKIKGFFLRFWDAYPSGRKRSKKEALKTFTKAFEDGADPEVIIAKAAEYAASPEGRGKYVAGPVPWINQGRWDDDPAAWQSDGSDKKPQDDFQYPKLGNANGRPG